ncbi:MAG: DUF3071 domain-containing protein [Actinobacteria bacterium]|nr:DUF3071 domain-containing protein [Actinomycetota bacterium]MBW3643121.1 DUF3071 domain-containing protein [Actinomycetota bacterium]
MQKLHFVGFTPELDGLILTDRKGSTSGSHVVPLDDRLLQLVSDASRMRSGGIGDRSDPEPRSNRAAARQGSALSPRELQDRLRAGSTVEEVAREAGTDIAWVTRFAAPVRAEQAQVVNRARELVLDKARLGPSSLPLGASVRRNLLERGLRLPDDELETLWSAFQLSDGLWVVRLAYTSRGRAHQAEWVVDLTTGRLAARDRLASQLGHVGKAAPAPPVSGDAPAVAPVEPPPPSRRRRRRAASAPSPAGDSSSTPTGAPPSSTPAATKAIAAKKARGAKKAAAATKATAGRKSATKAASTAAKKTPVDQKAPATKKAPAAKTPDAKKALAAKTPAAKKTPVAQKAPATKKAPAANTPAAKKTPVAQKAPAAKKATTAGKTPASTRATAANQATASPKVGGPTTKATGPNRARGTAPSPPAAPARRISPTPRVAPATGPAPARPASSARKKAPPSEEAPPARTPSAASQASPGASSVAERGDPVPAPAPTATPPVDVEAVAEVPSRVFALPGPGPAQDGSDGADDDIGAASGDDTEQLAPVRPPSEERIFRGSSSSKRPAPSPGRASSEAVDAGPGQPVHGPLPAPPPIAVPERVREAVAEPIGEPAVVGRTDRPAPRRAVPSTHDPWEVEETPRVPASSSPRFRPGLARAVEAPQPVRPPEIDGDASPTETLAALYPPPRESAGAEPKRRRRRLRRG